MHSRLTARRLGTLVRRSVDSRSPSRKKKKLKRGSSAKRVQCARKPFEEKESYRWLTTAEHCAEIKSHCPQTQLIMLADRESDITQVIDYCRGQYDFDWIIRSEGSRVLNRENKGDTSISVHDSLSKSQPLFQRELDIRARDIAGVAKR